jgi:hypothetical protein
MPESAWRLPLPCDPPDPTPRRSRHGRRAANGREIRLWASDGDGWLTMEATATLA